MGNGEHRGNALALHPVTPGLNPGGTEFVKNVNDPVETKIPEGENLVI